MYESYYSLKLKPFAMTSNPSFLYLSRRHKEALSSMLYGIKERLGFIEITGEVGTGKTTLCRALLDQLEKNVKTAFIFNSNMTEIQLMETIIEDLGIRMEKKNRHSMFSELNRFLIEQLAANNNVVLIIDEAQNLSHRLLEQIRMLSNLEAENEKLLQIVLVGQPELRDKLNKPSLRQLRQRIAVKYHIEALSPDEVPQYISRRLILAGANGYGPLFSEDAVREIARHTGGVPRLINILCDKALLMGYVREMKNISADMITDCIQESEGGVHV